MYDDFKKEELKQWIANNADVVFDDFKKQGSRFVSMYHLNGTKGSGGIVQSSVNGNLFKDFGNDEQLDGIALYMVRHNCDFKTALQCLSDISGIDVCQDNTGRTNVKYHRPAQSVVASTKVQQTAQKQYDFHDKQMLFATMRNYDCNVLAMYLIGRFGEPVAMDMMKRYNVGTAKVWNGATTFPYIDIDGNVCSIKIMLYEVASKFGITTPHRKKSENCQYITWGHSLLRLEKYNKKPCLFGEHLLRSNIGKKVAIVESEKTAVIASEYIPEFVWVACGGLANLTEEICQPLKFRDVVLFPDGGEVKQKKDGKETMVRCYSLWEEKARAIRHLFRSCSISTIIENRTQCTNEDWQNGIDLCDVLLRYPLPIQEKHLSPKESILQEMIEINPLLQNLIERFDLHLV